MKSRKNSRALVVGAVASTLLILAGVVLVVLHPRSAIGQAPSGSRSGNRAQAVGARSSSPAAHPGSSPATADPRRSRPAHALAWKVIGTYPGHNGINGTDPSYIAQ